MKNSTN